ncbi:MAG: hypothetical protein SGJ13_19085 [Actinomycetota bacterium]|nr:hypothetical protein [Actinomycetota bacterium]
MFESLDDTAPPPQPLDVAALRSRRAGRYRKQRRMGVAVASVAVVAVGWFAAIPDSPASDSAAPVVATPDLASIEDRDGNVGSPSDPSIGDNPVPAQPGDDAPPASSPERPVPGNLPSAPSGPPVGSDDVVWTATQSFHEMAWGTTPVMDITYTVRNNTATEKLYGPAVCDPFLRRFYVDDRDPHTMYADYSAGTKCSSKLLTVPAFGEATRTVSVRMLLTTGNIPSGDYTLSLGYAGNPVTIMVLPKP